MVPAHLARPPAWSRSSLWPGRIQLLVCVYDERCDAYFEIQPERDFALDVYDHPYAHVGH
jgi:hypothetical protein